MRGFIATALLLAALPVSGRADQPSEMVVRGEYVTRAADCISCHTVPGGTPFAGGRAFVLPIGVVYAPNITPDRATGIAGYSDDEWVRMLHDGVGRSGKRLYPAMPYPSLHADNSRGCAGGEGVFAEPGAGADLDAEGPGQLSVQSEVGIVVLEPGEQPGPAVRGG